MDGRMDGRMGERGTAARRGVDLLFLLWSVPREVSRYMYVEREREREVFEYSLPREPFFCFYIPCAFMLDTYPWETLFCIRERKQEGEKRRKIGKEKDVHLFHPHHHHYTTTRTTKTRNHRPRRQNHSDARNPNHDNNTRLSDNDIDIDIDIVIRGRIDIITSAHSACTCFWTWDISHYNGNFYSRNI